MTTVIMVIESQIYWSIIRKAETCIPIAILHLSGHASMAFLLRTVIPLTVDARSLQEISEAKYIPT